MGYYDTVIKMEKRNRYFDIKAWAAERFGHRISASDEVVGFIARNCPRFTLDLPAIALAGQFDYYYGDDHKSLQRGRKLRFFDEDFIIGFEDIYAAQPKVDAARHRQERSRRAAGLSSRVTEPPGLLRSPG